MRGEGSARAAWLPLSACVSDPLHAAATGPPAPPVLMKAQIDLACQAHSVFKQRGAELIKKVYEASREAPIEDIE